MDEEQERDSDAELRFGAFTLQPARRRLLRDGRPVPLGAREIALLLALAEQPGRVLDKRSLMARAWPGVVVEEGSLRVHISSLRRSLGEQEGQRWIENIPGRGYQFVAPVDRVGAGAGAAHAHAHAPAGLPLRLRTMLGRDAELAQLLARAGTPQQRLLTLTGPGGIGKTTLACAAAERLAPAVEAVCFADLAALDDPALLGATLAAALGLPVPDAPLPRLLAYLRDRSLLLVLDNCEHLIDAVAALAEALLAGAPRLRLLATSREPLRIQGESVLRLGPLPVPPPDAGAEVALGYPALALFVDCAQAHLHDFRPGSAELPLLAGLCERLEGNPLAIELAAAKVPAFGLAELARLLGQRFSMLSQGRRTAPARQQSLQATLAWSYDTLDATEQRLLRRLAQFRGPFTLAAALAVTACEPLAAEQVIAGLASLVAKSLLSPHAGGADPQFRLLASTHEFALALLQDSGEADTLARRHAGHLLALMETAQAADGASSPAAWRGALAVDIADLRAALDWAGSQADATELAVALAAASAPLWFHLGLLQEYLQRLLQARALAAALPDDALRELRLALAEGYARLQIDGPGEACATALAQALALARRLERPHDQLRALWSLFTQRVMRADYPGALGFGRDFAAVAAALHDGQALLAAERLQGLALHMQGEQDAALAHARRALDPGAARLHFLHGSTYQLDHQAAALATLARILWLRGEAEEARDLVDAAVQRAAAQPQGFTLTFVLAMVALPVALWAGDLALARRQAAQLADCVQRHSLGFWQGWSRLYLQLLDWLERAAPEDGAPDWLAEAAQHPSRADLLPTLDARLLDGHALRRLEAGAAGWCAAELRRVLALRALARGEITAAEARLRLRQALALAHDQGALAWAQRIEVSLTRVAG